MLRLDWPRVWVSVLLALSFTCAAALAVAAEEPPVAHNPGQFDLEQCSVELNSGYRMPIMHAQLKDFGACSSSKDGILPPTSLKLTFC